MGQRRGVEWIIDLKRHSLGPKQGYHEKKGTGSELLNFGKFISLYKSWQGLPAVREEEKQNQNPFTFHLYLLEYRISRFQANY